MVRIKGSVYVCLKGLFHPACLAHVASSFAFVVAISMALKDGGNIDNPHLSWCRCRCRWCCVSSINSFRGLRTSWQWRPGVFRQGGPAAKWRLFKSNIVIKSLNRLASLAIFLIFLMVLFDTLTWYRAECRHLIDLGK